MHIYTHIDIILHLLFQNVCSYFEASFGQPFPGLGAVAASAEQAKLQSQCGCRTIKCQHYSGEMTASTVAMATYATATLTLLHL